MSTKEIVGVLLAAGNSSRFGSAKLLHVLPSGMTIIEQSLFNLNQALAEVLVIVRENDSSLIDLLNKHAYPWIGCPNAHLGMAESIRCGISNRANAGGWIIALADMPYIPAATISSVRQALLNGAGIVAPSYAKQRGHPVGFHQRYFEKLMSLQGDVGARPILEKYQSELILLTTDDARVCIDIDYPEDIQ